MLTVGPGSLARGGLGVERHGPHKSCGDGRPRRSGPSPASAGFCQLWFWAQWTVSRN